MIPSKPLRNATIESEPPMEASKWLKLQVLADTQEMTSLFDALGHFEIFLTGILTQSGEGEISKPEFLSKHSYYVESLKKGEIPDEAVYRHCFSTIFTVTSDVLYVVPMPENRQLIRISKPVIQLQAHSMDYSIHDGKFRPMVFGLDSILWGIQFSYPQLYLDPKTKEVHQVVDSEMFPNTRLFRLLQKWIRQATMPTPFHVGQEKINVPMRLGKESLGWINQHPQLLKKKLTVG